MMASPACAACNSQDRSEFAGERGGMLRSYLRRSRGWSECAAGGRTSTDVQNAGGRSVVYEDH